MEVTKSLRGFDENLPQSRTGFLMKLPKGVLVVGTVRRVPRLGLLPGTGQGSTVEHLLGPAPGISR